MEKYKKVNTDCGTTIDDVYKVFQFYKKEGKDVSTEFNGKELNSDMSLDEMYLLVTGRTREEFNAECERRRKKEKEEEAEYKAKIPELEKYWVEEGKNFVTKNIEKWNECVSIRLRDLYCGMELSCLQEVAEYINKKQYDIAKTKIEKQGHSGMSFYLIKSMIATFLENGQEFLKKTYAKGE